MDVEVIRKENRLEFPFEFKRVDHYKKLVVNSSKGHKNIQDLEDLTYLFGKDDGIDSTYIFYNLSRLDKKTPILELFLKNLLFILYLHHQYV